MNRKCLPRSNEERGLVVLTFLRNCITMWHTVGAVAPSSRFLGECLAKAGRVAEASVIVEFGPGTGVLTRSIVPRLQPDATFFMMEINKEFVDVLEQRFPNVPVFHDSATNTRKHLEDFGLDGCDCIISGLPWTIFDDDLQDALLDTVQDVLRPGGRFITFAYIMSPLMSGGKKFRRKLHERFNGVAKTKVVWLNLPPAFGYCVEKKDGR